MSKKVYKQLNNDTIREAIKEYNHIKNKFEYGPISEWDVSQVTNMSDLMENKSNFNEDISDWDVSNVEDMTGMFSNATSFNQDISRWDVSKVKNMSFMFDNAISFNQDISEWDVSNVKDMNYMFFDASSFNQDISRWNVSKVEDMFRMFYRATAFNQRLDAWQLKSNVRTKSMFRKSGCHDCEPPYKYPEELLKTYAAVRDFKKKSLLPNDITRIIDSYVGDIDKKYDLNLLDKLSRKYAKKSSKPNSFELENVIKSLKKTNNGREKEVTRTKRRLKSILDNSLKTIHGGRRSTRKYNKK